MTTAPEPDLSAIASLVLVRLLVTAAKGDTVAKLQKDLEPLLAHRWQDAELAQRIDQTLTDLESISLVAVTHGKSKKSVSRVVATAAGQRWSLNFLGVAQLRPKTTWGVLRKTYLPSCVLGVPVASEAQFKAFSSEPAFQALLLKHQFGLTTAEMPRPDEATDALAWKLIGFEGETGKFNPRNIKTLVFNRALSDGRATDFKKAATRLLAQRMGARRDDPKELRDAVLRGWIDERDRDGQQTASLPFPSWNGLDLPSFAERVKAAARLCPTGRFGESKVFIAHVWRWLQADPAFATMDLAIFKKRLAEANNARRLDLSRADLVQAMDPNDVEQSEVHYLNATFHFVRI